MPKPIRAQQGSRRAASPRTRAKKISLTVDEGIVAAMEHEARKSKRTLSAEITDALARELRRRRLQELVTSYEQDKGKITAKELATIQAEWLG